MLFIVLQTTLLTKNLAQSGGAVEYIDYNFEEE